MTDMTLLGESVKTFFIQEFGQNSLGAYIVSLAIIVIGISAVRITRRIALKRLDRWIASSGRYGIVDKKLVTAVVNALLLLLYLLPLYWALGSLTFSKGIGKAVDFVFLVLFTLSMVRFLANLVGFVLDTVLRNHSEDSAKTKGVGALMPIVRTIVWAVGVTFLLDNLGFQISSIVAGLGIMGVAVGLAGQAILGDFFSYLVILMDQPFAIGDVVNLGNVIGTVEHIGIKTTRIRTPSGEVLVCPNGDLTKQRLTNYYPAHKRGRVFTFGVTYETPLEKVRAVPDIVRELAAALPGEISVDRIHFLTFGDSSLNFEVQISVPGHDGGPLLDAQHALNLAIMERFAKENIEFAYPTNLVYLAKTA